MIQIGNGVSSMESIVTDFVSYYIFYESNEQTKNRKTVCMKFYDLRSIYRITRDH